MDFKEKVRKYTQPIREEVKKYTQPISEAASIGLSSEGEYRHAYEKGVFCRNYKVAVDKFKKAAEGFEKDNDLEMASFARANSTIYTLLMRRDWISLEDAIIFLEPLDGKEIEQIGSNTKKIETRFLLLELKALQLEHRAGEMISNEEKARAYFDARKLLLELANSSEKGLSFIDIIDVPGPKVNPLLRADYYGGISDYYMALNAMLVSPVEAYEYFEKSAHKLKDSGYDDRELLSEIEGYIDRMKKRRHCWICGREMQGLDIFYKHYPAKSGEYHRILIKSSSEDIGMLDTDGKVTLCTLCGSIIETQSQAYAEAYEERIHKWAAPLIEEHGKSIKEHSQILEQLKEAYHRDSQILEQLKEAYHRDSQLLGQLQEISHRHNQ